MISGTPGGPLRDCDHDHVGTEGGTLRNRVLRDGPHVRAVLGQAEVARLLDETLQEEQSADAKLRKLLKRRSTKRRRRVAPSGGWAH